MSSFSYGQSTAKESLWDKIKDLDVLETYVTSTSGRVNVTQKIHSWNEDPIVSLTSQPAGIIENANTVYNATNPVLRFNTTQIFERGILVSGTTQNTDMAGMANKFAREQMKKMKEWKNEFEWAATVGTLMSGTGTQIRQMAGIVRFASSLVTTHSAVSLTSDLLNDNLRVDWEVAGVGHEVALVNPVLKARISSFTAANVRNVEASAATLFARVDVYDSDFGRIRIIPHRFINRASGGAVGVASVLVTYIPDYVQIGFLDEPHLEDRARTGYFKAGAIVGEATIQVSNERAINHAMGLR